MSNQDTILFDQVVISQKRAIYIKLRNFTSDQYGESTFIELQEVRKEQDGNKYGTPLRIPASEKSILLAELIKDFTLEYRKVRRLKNKKGANNNQTINNSNNNDNTDEIKTINSSELSVLIFENFRGKQVIKSNINSFLTANKITGNTTEALGLLQKENKVEFEEKVSKSGNKYQLWSFVTN